MSIKRQVDYDKNNDCNSGFTNIGNSTTKVEIQEATTQALTSMVVAMNMHIKLTVGYFLMKKLSAPFQAHEATSRRKFEVSDFSNLFYFPKYSKAEY